MPERCMSESGIERERYRRVFLTVNNYTDGCIDGLGKLSKRCTFFIYGREIGKKCGTPHIHFYGEFRGQLEFRTIKRFVPRADVRVPRGTGSDCVRYISKEDPNPITGGSMRGRENGEDALKPVDRAIQLVAERGLAGYNECAILYPKVFVYRWKGLLALSAHTTPHRDTMPTVTVLWGPTGTGKSHRARQLAGHMPFVWGPDVGKWFDGYGAEDCVIFEEFRGQLPFGMLLRLLDKWDCKVEVKGGTVPFVATNIILTSPKHPETWYHLEGQYDKISQLMRRITTCVNMYLPFGHELWDGEDYQDHLNHGTGTGI